MIWSYYDIDNIHTETQSIKSYMIVHVRVFYLNEIFL